MNRKKLNWVITGANGNVGKAILDLLDTRKETALGISRGSIHRTRDNIEFPLRLKGDLTQLKDVEYLVELIIDHLNTIDVWINVAGGFSMGSLIEETTDEDWQSMFNLNVQTGLNCAKTVIPHMKNNGFGRIINFGSLAGENGMALAGPYALSKAAVVSLTKTMAQEGRKYGVTCNAIIPGTIDTPQNRASMPDADRSTWTSLKTIAESIIRVVYSNQTGETIHV